MWNVTLKNGIMDNYGIRPLDNYIFEADWQQLYILTEHWLSDLYFYRDDLRFLHHLIDNYFKWLTKAENINKVVALETSLLVLEKQGVGLIQRVKKHLEHLSGLIDDPFKYDSHTFRQEHQQLENDLSSFVKDFRVHRKSVFEITEYLMDADEVKSHLLK
jgi:hypothetical protein|tara:strand:+ start:3175 stop:3654 length:480 start_codon:yes stop_codon:yes gene_type:complete